MARPIRKTSLLSVYSLLVLLMMGMAGCEKDVIEEGTNNGAREANALLQVRTRGGGLGYRTLGADESAWPTANTTDSYRLRPVAVVSVTTE